MPIRVERIVHVSGGKDSTAVYLKMLEGGRPFRAVFADVQNEADETYDFIAELPRKTGGPQVEIVRADVTGRLAKKRARLPARWRKLGKSDAEIAAALDALQPSGNVFLDLCAYKGLFPSNMRRFCTQELKVAPVVAQVFAPVVASGRVPCSILGIRAEEGGQRRWAEPLQRATTDGVSHLIWRPILHWTLDDVMRIHARHGLQPNALYAQGFSRVGCYPCIFARKNEITMVAQNADAIDRIEAWEERVGKASVQGDAFFFHPGKQQGNEDWCGNSGIRNAVRWARTKHGGRQFMLDLPADKGDVQRFWSTVCSAQGLCE